MTLQIRRAQPADAEVVSLLGRITFAETFGPLFADYAADLRSYLDRTFNVVKIRNSLAETDNRYWLASLDGLPVAYAKVKYPSPTPQLPGNDPAQLQKIYVLREFLSEGTGRTLFAAVLEDSAARGLNVLWLDVLKQNSRAITFYEHKGFKAIGEDTYTIGAQKFRFHLMALHGLSARH
jgi:ribosomal protein S18 acetylase RimI-like enzyme